FDEAPPPSASVLALVAQDAMTADLVPQIKQLVAYSVENIDYERVGVVVSAVEQPARPDVELVTLGGVIMYASSMTRAMALAGGIAILGLALGAGATLAVEAYLKAHGREVA